MISRFNWLLLKQIRDKKGENDNFLDVAITSEAN